MKIVSTFKPSPAFKLPNPEQEDAVQDAGLLLVAVGLFREQAREALLATPADRESYSRYQSLAAALKVVERAVAREYDKAGLPAAALDFTPLETLGRHTEHLPAALELVTGQYRESLATVGMGTLVDASALDAARKAIRHEIAAAGSPS